MDTGLQGQVIVDDGGHLGHSGHGGHGGHGDQLRVL